HVELTAGDDVICCVVRDLHGLRRLRLAPHDPEADSTREHHEAQHNRRTDAQPETRPRGGRRRGIAGWHSAKLRRSSAPEPSNDSILNNFTNVRNVQNESAGAPARAEIRKYARDQENLRQIVLIWRACPDLGTRAISP